MASAKKDISSHLNLVHYDRLVATQPEASWKGDKMPSTTMNGNMYSFLHTTGEVALRLPAEDRLPFLDKYNTKLFDAFGVVQKEYVTIPADDLHKTEELAPYFAKSFAYVKTLKVKPSKAKK